MEHAQILREAMDGNDAALDILVRTYHDRVYRFGRGICRNQFDADDAVQEAFIKLASRPDVQRDVTVLSWLMSVVRNACLRMLKSFHRTRPLLLEGSGADSKLTMESSLITETTPEGLLERWQLIDEVHRAIAALPTIYRQVLLLRDIDGQSGDDVARALRVSESAMKTRLHRARQMMRDELIKNQLRKQGAN